MMLILILTWECLYEQGQLKKLSNRNVRLRLILKNARYHLGVAYLDKQEIDSAIDALVRVVNLSPTDSYACFHLGQAYESNQMLRKQKLVINDLKENAPANTQIRKICTGSL